MPSDIDLLELVRMLQARRGTRPPPPGGYPPFAPPLQVLEDLQGRMGTGLPSQEGYPPFTPPTGPSAPAEPIPPFEGPGMNVSPDVLDFFKDMQMRGLSRTVTPIRRPGDPPAETAAPTVPGEQRLLGDGDRMSRADALKAADEFQALKQPFQGAEEPAAPSTPGDQGVMERMDSVLPRTGSMTRAEALRFVKQMQNEKKSYKKTEAQAEKKRPLPEPVDLVQKDQAQSTQKPESVLEGGLDSQSLAKKRAEMERQLRLEKLTRDLGEGFGAFAKYGPLTAGGILMGQRGTGGYQATDTRNRIDELEYQTLDENDPNSPISQYYQELIKRASGIDASGMPASVLQSHFRDIVGAGISSMGAGAGGARQLPASALRELAKFDAALAGLDELEASVVESPEVQEFLMDREIPLVPDFMEQLINSGRRKAASVGSSLGIASPDYTRFNQAMKSIQNRYIQAITGAQMSIHEAKRIIGALPRDFDNLENFKVRLQGSRKEMQRMLDAHKKYFHLGGYKTGDPALDRIATEEDVKQIWREHFGGGNITAAPATRPRTLEATPSQTDTGGDSITITDPDDGKTKTVTRREYELMKANGLIQ